MSHTSAVSTSANSANSIRLRAVLLAAAGISHAHAIQNTSRSSAQKFSGVHAHSPQLESDVRR
jgi:hypothetical protein